MNPRRPLHQRSDSDTNSGSKVSTSPTVLQKESPPIGSPPSAKNSKQHKSQSSSHSSVGTLSRSNTTRSDFSLDSLPPVPPLRIRKHQSSSLEEPSQDGTGSSYSYAPPRGQPHAEASSSNSAAPPGPAHTQNPVRLPPDQIFPILPRSILKKSSKTALPPFGENDYRYKSTSWVGSQALNLTPNRARINAKTVRMVNTVGVDMSGSATPEDSGQRQRQASRSSDGTHTFSSASAASRALPQRTETPVQPTPAFVRQFPPWARYFYGRRGGRTSLLATQETTSSTSQTPPIGVAITSPDYIGPIVDTHSHIGFSPQLRDPETSTMWSLPHLDHSPRTRLEQPGRQVVLFCLGFLIPIFWWIGAVLPLPLPIQSEQTYIHSADIEAWGATVASSKEARTLELASERRYLNARWWRRVNRVLSVMGLLILAAAIALLTAAIRMPPSPASSAI